MYHHLEIEQRGTTAMLWLNRPEVRNAMDDSLIAEITDAVERMESDDSIRVIVVGGKGQAFCAGGDLNWMRRMADYDEARNQKDALALAHMLNKLARCAKPTIGRVQGAAFAGGMGLAAACDIIVAEAGAKFCLSEVRIGLIPSTISPYVVQALGLQASKRYMLSGERFDAQEGYRLGFVHEVCPPESLDSKVHEIANALTLGGPQALAQTKVLLAMVNARSVDSTLIEQTAKFIASVRASTEGKEGVSSFLEKRAPAWASMS